MNTYAKPGEGGRSLHRFQTGLACLLGVRLADPHHAASHGAKRVLVKDELDRLPASQPEISVQPEPALRGVDHQTGNSRLASFEVDNQAGALLRRNPPQAAAFGNGKGGHAFAPVLEVATIGPESFLAGRRFPQPLREHVDQGSTAQQGQRYEYA